MLKHSRRNIARYIASSLANNNAETGKIVSQLAAYLIENKQVNETDLIIRDINTELAMNHDTLNVNVISAHKLSENILNAVETFVSKQTECKNISLYNSVDTSIIGGIVIQTPLNEFDNSIRTKLNQLNRI